MTFLSLFTAHFFPLFTLRVPFQFRNRSRNEDKFCHFSNLFSLFITCLASVVDEFHMFPVSFFMKQNTESLICYRWTNWLSITSSLLRKRRLNEIARNWHGVGTTCLWLFRWALSTKRRLQLIGEDPCDTRTVAQTGHCPWIPEGWGTERLCFYHLISSLSFKDICVSPHSPFSSDYSPKRLVFIGTTEL